MSLEQKKQRKRENPLVDQIMNSFNAFTDGVRVLMLIERGIQSSNKGSRRWINKLISSNQLEFRANLVKLLDQQAYLNNKDIRLYSCVNSRNMGKAIKHFQHKQIDLSAEGEAFNFYRRINDKFCSSLMQPENRSSSRFLIDLDDTDPTMLNDILNACNIDIILKYQTPNGWHYITEPFNPAIISNSDIDSCEVKKDALLLLNWLQETT